MVYSLHVLQPLLLGPWRPRRPPRSQRGRVLSPVLGFWRARSAPETPLPPSPSVLTSPQAGPSALQSDLSPDPWWREMTWGTHVTRMVLRPQIPAAGIWLLREGLSYSVSYPVNSGLKAGSGEAETTTPREMESWEKPVGQALAVKRIVRNLEETASWKRMRLVGSGWGKEINSEKCRISGELTVNNIGRCGCSFRLFASPVSPRVLNPCPLSPGMVSPHLILCRPLL